MKYAVGIIVFLCIAILVLVVLKWIRTPSRPVWSGTWKVLGTLLVLVIVGAVIYWAYTSVQWHAVSLSCPSCETIWGFAKTYWLWILIGAIILYTLIELGAKPLGNVKGILQGFIVMTILTMFVICPIVGWITAPGKPSSSAAPAFTAPSETEQLQQRRLWIPPNGDSVHIKIPIGRGIALYGSGFTLHYVYDDGTESTATDGQQCPAGAVSHAYVHNDTNNWIVVPYEFK